MFFFKKSFVTITSTVYGVTTTHNNVQQKVIIFYLCDGDSYIYFIFTVNYVMSGWCNHMDSNAVSTATR